MGGRFKSTLVALVAIFLTTTANSQEATTGNRREQESPARGTDQRSPSRFFLTDDIQYFPSPADGVYAVKKEASAVPAKPLAAPVLTPVAPPASTTITAPVAVTPPAAPLSKQRRQRRAKWSETLQTPAAVVVDPAETVTLGDLLERIRKQHGLPVRVDLAHVLPMTAMAEMTTARLKPKTSSNATARSIGPGITLPIGVYNTYSSEPLAPPTYAPVSGWGTPNAPAGAVPYEPVAPARHGSPVPLQAYKPVAVSEKEEPVSAIQAEVIGDSPKEPPQSPKMPPVVAEPEDDGDQDTGKSEVTQGIQKMLTEMLSTPVDAAVINQTEATVEDLLRQAFDRSFPLQTLINASLSEEIPMLTSLSRATEWDLLIQDDGVLLTTRLNANLHKETRVYSVKALEKSAGLKAEDVARVLTRTVRPWSWKQNFPAAVTADKPNAQDKSKAGTKTGKKYTVPKINFDLSSLISASAVASERQLRLVNNLDGTTTVVPDTKSENVEITEEDLELLRRAWDGLFQGAVSSIQVIYHADPPTGVLEVLPGMLVISQSQGAHREIADLIEQLSEPAN